MAIPVDAPCLPSGSQEFEARVRRRLDELVDLAKRRFSTRLRAILLGGSLARGEGVVLRRGTDAFLVSDIDMYLVVEPEVHPEDHHEVESIVQELAEDPFFAAPVDLGVIDPQWFAHVDAGIPAHQFVYGHRMLFSRKGDVPVDIPAVREDGPWSIDPDDALKLIMNRYGEALVIAGDHHEDPFALYHRWKIFLDAPLAWLAAHGAYHPRREVQLERLEQVWVEGGRIHAAWFREGIELQREMLKKLRAGPVEMSTMAELPFPARRGRGGVLSWSWPFFRSILNDRVEGRGRLSPGESLADAVGSGSPSRLDAERGKEWLRRLPLSVRLREARRWARQAPRPHLPWWRHALDGVGRERVQMACALKFGALPEWIDILHGLLPQDDLLRGSRADDPDRWLGRLWSRWVMGGSR